MHRLLDAFLALKKAGKARLIGASVKGPDVTEDTVRLAQQYVDSGKIDVLQLIYSVFRQKNRAVFSYAQQNGVGIVARTVLESGFLTGKYAPGQRFGDPDHRQRWQGARLDNLLGEAQELHRQCEQHNRWSLHHAAMRFAYEEPAIDCIIPGAKRPDQVASNVSVADGAQLPPLLKAHFYDHYCGRDAEFNTG
jgi:aryl-alcohol dehydrogenase-like predicted oxidoreductase